MHIFHDDFDNEFIVSARRLNTMPLIFDSYLSLPLALCKVYGFTMLAIAGPCGESQEWAHANPEGGRGFDACYRVIGVSMGVGLAVGYFFVCYDDVVDSLLIAIS